MSIRRTLYIVRHAKSTWDIEGISDIDRPLKLRGIRAAYEMSRRLKIERHFPQKIIASPANRALHTAVIFHRVFEQKKLTVDIDERLYATGVATIKRLVAQQQSDIKRLMIFGHNPDFSELATNLTGEGYVELPTCGLCAITFEADDWSSISAGKMVQFFTDIPKNKELKYLD